MSVFFYLRWKINNSPKLAIVWSRNITSYWEKAISMIIPDLVSYFSIVSGGALWCYIFAQTETIKNNWTTISVIWTGIDIDIILQQTKKCMTKLLKLVE